ncbi:hypothetical protein N5079_32300 [Planotetraspora sp. A-T 1434]|uniref:hypothetical protein n=1 Tax=Planotetraspora sp. A-T 1434 TaxID=2979219 RepID=UPI0021C23185|nr:hypothetical protein [Planotetraspora sp. A-T 1434]MCT9934899.1 hypothetical protein [Planotetraspora sp. A-T 1434]
MLIAVADETIIGVDTRPLTQRERAVLEALLSVGFQDVETLRRRAAEVVVVGMCGCGCPSIDFQHGRGLGMAIRVNAGVRGSHDGLFLYTIEDPQRGEVLGGIEWVGVEETNPDELPSPERLDIQAA